MNTDDAIHDTTVLSIETYVADLKTHPFDLCFSTPYAGPATDSTASS